MCRSEGKGERDNGRTKDGEGAHFSCLECRQECVILYRNVMMGGCEDAYCLLITAKVKN